MCASVAIPAGGELFTPGSERCSDQGNTPRPPVRPCKRRIGNDTCDDADELDAFVKRVVDALPPLTEEQRDLLALIFRGKRSR
jgi:hypothetical protein